METPYLVPTAYPVGQQRLGHQGPHLGLDLQINCSTGKQASGLGSETQMISNFFTQRHILMGSSL